MASSSRDSARQRAKRWNEKIAAATKVYDAWATDFEVVKCRQYYDGHQWRGQTDEERKNKYTINLVFPTVEAQQPALMFFRPQVKIDARPPHADDAGSDAAARASLCESTVQTYIDDPKLHFATHTTLALRDTPFAFGVVEVGYSADWIDNPNVGKPVRDENDKEIAGTAQPAKVVKRGSETLYVKRIPPHTWRVSQSGRNILDENDWCGYYEWHFVEDLKANPRYNNTSRLKATGTVDDGADQTTDADPDRAKHRGMVKVWKIWDLRAKVRHVLVDGDDKFLLEDDPFAFLPFQALKFFERADEWYPLPPVFNWLSPQDEINESRDQQKVHRRRFNRRYTYLKDRIDKTELDKIEQGDDGTFAEAKEVDPIQPVPDAELSGSNWTQLAATKEDFTTISGATAESRGVPEADTATQANIIEGRNQLRESSQRVAVGQWLAGIARLMLFTLRDRMQLPFWVKVNTDPLAKDVAAKLRTVQGYQQITSKDLGDFDVDVKVDIASLSPVSLDGERIAWNQVLALLTNPAMLALLMQPSPDAPNEPSPLLRKTLGFYNIKSDTEVREIFRVGATVLTQMQLAASMAAAAKGGGMPGAGLPGAAGMPATPGQPPAGTPAPPKPAALQ